MATNQAVPNDWIERVEQRVKELLVKKQFEALVLTVPAVPPEDRVPAISITPKWDGIRRDFLIRAPETGDDGNLNEEGRRILRELNETLQPRGMVSDFDPLD
jgi:hypothetical protein